MSGFAAAGLGALEALLGGGVGSAVGTGAALTFGLPPLVDAGVEVADKFGGYGKARWQKIIDAQGRAAAMGGIPKFLDEQNALRDSRWADLLGSIPKAQGADPTRMMSSENAFLGSLGRENQGLLAGMAARYQPDSTGAFLSRLMQEYQPMDRI